MRKTEHGPEASGEKWGPSATLVSLVLFSIFSFPLSAFAGTFYISASLGSDANTSTQAQQRCPGASCAPWAHVPGMKNATGNAATYTPVAGDTFVLMGGDTWSMAGNQWVMKGNGNSTTPITYTVDPTWYNATACANWATVNTYATGPVPSDPSNVVLASATSFGFDNDLVGKTVTIGGTNYTVQNLAFGGNREAMVVTPTPPTASNVAMTTTGIWCQPRIDFGWTLTCNFPTQTGESCAGIDAATTSYITFNDIDVGRFQPVNCNLGTCYRANAINVTTGSNVPATGTKWTNNFFHDADAVSGTISTGSDNFWIGVAGILDQGNTCSNQNNGLSYAAGNCFGASTNGQILGNWCYRTNGCADYSGPGIEVAYNTMYKGQDDTVDNGDHGNTIHAMCGPTYIHHNLIFDIGPNGAGMTTLMEPSETFNSGCPNGGAQTYYVWDNVNFQASNGTCWVLYAASAGTTAITYTLINNTCVPSGSVLGTPSGGAVRVAGAATMPAQVNIINMHVLSSGWTGATAPVTTTGTTTINPFVVVDSGYSVPISITTSVPQSATSALSQGYATSFPDNGHVVTANGLAPSASGNASVGQGTNETSLATGALATLINYANWTNPSGTLGTRPAGKWSAGAYEIGALPMLRPKLPPLNLLLSAH